MPRSSLRIRCTQSTVDLASPAGSTVKTWPYLFLKYRALFARRPASAAAWRAFGSASRPQSISRATGGLSCKFWVLVPQGQTFANSLPMAGQRQRTAFCPAL
jgi:hypothetical protein